MPHPLKALTLLLAVIVALVAGGCVREGDPQLYPPAAREDTVDVYVAYNWIHANIVVRRDALASGDGPTARAVALTTDAPWVLLGWGDSFCYRERGLTPARLKDMAWFMLTLDSPSVLLVDPIESFEAPDMLRRRVIALELSEDGFRRMTDRIDAYFAVRDGSVLLAGRGRSPDSWFFLSDATTDVFFTCNHWVGDVLNAAGVPVTPLLNLLPYGLAHDLRRGAGAGRIRQQTTPADYFETLPAYSGAFGALGSPAEEVTGGLRFLTFRIAFEHGQIYDTVPLALVLASERAPGGLRSYAELLDVDPRSLVALRRVARESHPDAPGLCTEEATRRLAIGYRYPTGKQPYRIAIAAFGGAGACGVYRYRQH